MQAAKRVGSALIAPKHQLLNVVLGGSLLVMSYRLSSKDSDFQEERCACRVALLVLLQSVV